MFKLKKALYGIKQAPQAWYSKIDLYLINNGVGRSNNEPTLYVRIGRGKILLACLYVDDMIYTGNFMLDESLVCKPKNRESLFITCILFITSIGNYRLGLD